MAPPISARPQYRPPAAPAVYDAGWLRTQLANISRAISPVTVRTLVGAGTASATDDLILCNATTAPFTVTLPPANQVQFLKLTLKKIDASANAVTLGGTIDGVLNSTLAAQYKSVTIQSDGISWYKIASV